MTQQRLDMLEKMIAKGSADPFVHYARCMELKSLGRTTDAMDAFRKLRERFPNYVPLYLMAGQVAVELGAADEAREFFSEGEQKAREAGDSHAQAELARALAGLA
jgi:tetratricopeptide (TPR) repeat protein